MTLDYCSRKLKTLPASHAAPRSRREPEDRRNLPYRIFERPDSGWYRFDTSLSDLSLLDAECMLARNRSLSGGVKLCLSESGSPCLRYEVPAADEHISIEDRRLSAIHALDGGIMHLRGVAHQPPGCQEEGNHSFPVAVSEICSNSGWLCEERSSGCWSVELATTYHVRAAIRVIADEVVIEAPLGEWFATEPTCLFAVCKLLVRACGLLRMVRATVEPTDGGVRALLLANVQPHTLDTDLVPALCALSVGVCSLQGEVRALHSPDIAGRYLAITARDAGGSRANKENDYE